jgi:hypothetical protein
VRDRERGDDDSELAMTAEQHNPTRNSR